MNRVFTGYNFIYSYIFLVLLRPQEYIESFKNVPILPVVLVLALVSWVFFDKEKYLKTPQTTLLPIFFIFMMISIILNGWMGGAVVVFSNFFTVLVLFTLISSTVQSEERLRKIMLLITVMSVLMAIHGIQQNQTGVGWTGVKPVSGGRITYLGIFNDPNDLGTLFVISLPMAAYLFKYTKKYLHKILLLASLLVILYGIFLTNSRGSMLAVFVMVSIYTWKRYGLNYSIAFLALLLPLAFLIPSRLGEISASEESAQGRVDAWYEGIQMFKDSPLYGVGTGQFTENNYLTAHNSFVLVLAEQGIIGFFLWFSFIGITFVMLKKMFLKVEEAINLNGAENRENLVDNKNILAALTLSFIALIITISLLSRSYSVIVYIVIGLIVGYYNGFRKRYDGILDVQVKFNAAYWFMLSILAIIFLYVLTKVLLIFS